MDPWLLLGSDILGQPRIGEEEEENERGLKAGDQEKRTEVLTL